MGLHALLLNCFLVPIVTSSCSLCLADTSPPSRAHGEIDIDRRLHFSWHPEQQVWLISPLPYRGDGRNCEIWIRRRNNMQRQNVAVDADDCMQYHGARDMVLFRRHRIHWRGLAQSLPSDYARTAFFPQTL